MTDSGQAPVEGPKEDPTIVVFLGLYLLLLAFFWNVVSTSYIINFAAYFGYTTLQII